MVAGSLTSIEVQQNVLTLFEEEYTHQDIVKRVGISRRTVDRILKRGHVKQKNDYTKKTGRPKKLSPIKVKEIKGIVKEIVELQQRKLLAKLEKISLKLP